MTSIRPITRNDSAIALAVLAAIMVVAAPIAAIFAIWQSEVRWLYTGVALLALAFALYFIATRLFDETAK